MRTTLEAQEGVEAVEVDFASKTATVKAGDAYDSQAALAALEQAGFPSKPR